MAYGDRPQVEVEVSDRTTLAEALEMAAVQLGISVNPSDDWHGEGSKVLDYCAFVAFYKPEDEEGHVLRRWDDLHDILIVEEDGGLRWRNEASTVSYADLLRTEEAGLLDGEALRPYLILQPPAGNGVLVSLAAVYFGYKLLLDLLKGGPAIAENVDLFKRLQRRIERTRCA